MQNSKLAYLPPSDVDAAPRTHGSSWAPRLGVLAVLILGLGALVVSH